MIMGGVVVAGQEEGGNKLGKFLKFLIIGIAVVIIVLAIMLGFVLLSGGDDYQKVGGDADSDGELQVDPGVPGDVDDSDQEIVEGVDLAVKSVEIGDYFGEPGVKNVSVVIENIGEVATNSAFSVVVSGDDFSDIDSFVFDSGLYPEAGLKKDFFVNAIDEVRVSVDFVGGILEGNEENNVVIKKVS